MRQINPNDHLGSFGLITINLDLIRINNRFLTADEYEFVSYVKKDIDIFYSRTVKSPISILIFPPLPPKQRFLIHEIVSQLYGDTLSTFSINQDRKRRPIIYLKSLYSKEMSDHINDANKESKPKDRKKHKHPDKPLYQPPKSKNTSKMILSNRENDEPVKDSHEELQEEKDENDLTWDSLYDDNGDIIINELNSHLGIDIIKPDNLWKSTLDYKKFCDKVSLNTDEISNHILEIYDFSPDLKTRDLTSCFSFNFKNFEIDWVDDTHALIIFQSSLQASEALNKVYPILKLRPLSHAIPESKLKAKKIKESGLTRKLRPETSAITARRLVIGALGIKANLNPEQSQAEREKLRLAKEKKEKSLKQAKNIWNDIS